jgi:hypothetical protein
MDDGINEDFNQGLAMAWYSAGHPFSTIENPYLVQTLKKARPAWRLPTRRQLAEKYLDCAYSTLKGKVNQSIDQAQCVGISTDGWTNVRRESVMNFMVLTPTPFFYESIITNEEKHTGVYIAQELSRIINKIGREKGIVFTVH